MYPYEIKKDLRRTQIGNEEFKLDPESGKNRLFNVLNAYSCYDPEIGYSQGMNFLVAVLLKRLDEQDAFFMLIHLMEVLQWRGCFDFQLGKLDKLLTFLNCVLETAWPEIYERIF
jgi:hypothetical protein